MTRRCVLCDPGRGVTLLSHVTRDTHPRHISIFSYFTLRPARAWCLTTGRAICRGNTAPRLRLLCRLTTTITSIMQEKFHFPPLFHVTDFTPYTLNIHNSEQCPGGAALPHASPHALAQAVKSKAKNFNWPFPLFLHTPLPAHGSLPSQDTVKSCQRNFAKLHSAWRMPLLGMLACKDHNRQVVWLAKILKAAVDYDRVLIFISVCSSVVAMSR